MHNRRELEICVETLQACEAAAEGGADRVELCAALSEGGVTPSLGFVCEAISAVALPVHVLMRPRSSGFVYSESEFRMICFDIESNLDAGAAGIVVGVLTAGNTIDETRLARIVACAQGRPVTFHRAFDQSTDLAESLEMLIDLGCSRVLTSGGKPTVMQGYGMLARLAVQAAGRIRIAAGGGVTLENASQLAAIRDLDIHASLRAKAKPNSGDPLWCPSTGNISADSVRALGSIVHQPSQLGKAKAT